MARVVVVVVPEVPGLSVNMKERALVKQVMVARGGRGTAPPSSPRAPGHPQMMHRSAVPVVPDWLVVCAAYTSPLCCLSTIMLYVGVGGVGMWGRVSGAGRE